MDKFTAPATDSTLTLAFGKAATQDSKVFHPWRYFVADGETLAKINTFIADFANVDAARAALCAKLGAKSFDGTYGFRFDFAHTDMVELAGTERVDYHMSGGEGNEPWQSKRVLSIPDFVISDGRAFGQCHPDVSTERGREIRAEAMAIEDMANPAARLAKWLGAHNLDVPASVEAAVGHGTRVKMSATATKVGNDWVIAVPVELKLEDYTAKTYSEKWIVPPGATPMSVGEYFTRLEKANLIKNTPAPGK